MQSLGEIWARRGRGRTYSRWVLLVVASSWMTGSSIVVGTVTNSSPPCKHSGVSKGRTRRQERTYAEIAGNVDHGQESIRSCSRLDLGELSSRQDPRASFLPKAAVEEYGRVGCDLRSLINRQLESAKEWELTLVSNSEKKSSGLLR